MYIEHTKTHKQKWDRYREMAQKKHKAASNEAARKIGTWVRGRETHGDEKRTENQRQKRKVILRFSWILYGVRLSFDVLFSCCVCVYSQCSFTWVAWFARVLLFLSFAICVGRSTHLLVHKYFQNRHTSSYTLTYVSGHRILPRTKWVCMTLFVINSIATRSFSLSLFISSLLTFSVALYLCECIFYWSRWKTVSVV